MSFSIEIVHDALHITQLITLGIILYYFVTLYRTVRSSFNIGLIVFCLALIVEVIFAWSFEVLTHTVSEGFLLAALIIFLVIARK